MDTSKLGRFCNLERRFSLAALKRNMMGAIIRLKKFLGRKPFPKIGMQYIRIFNYSNGVDSRYQLPSSSRKDWD